ncbi:alpha/beta fold hydrolase [Bacillus sp. GX]|uniref:Alpha/beta hydrolase n=1 Tax=Bacillus albus TaxID=2026189 RepID=A0A1J9T8Y8_9BACI|nr:MULTISPECIES: alpha/beta hydrolase [Bacillus]AZQ48814.1 alpha/beta hydrolase [Bacillus albus]MDA2028329.1 alpha/beta hydrolase [Bacillus cereus group sp. Bcc03]MDA2714923.1 alpha/beta hydrolase [Bacillus cereus group sp. Bc025]MDC6155067.1 alpha/beta hydrolase [Bacillus albus]MDD8004544.1 alpha/beta hydrolase [Bacillus albus]
MKRDNNKIGHFISEKGKEDFQIAYDESMALLPAPKDMKDIETTYGTIRTYYFTKEENKHKEPILLLPGRGASTPMWVPNLEGLREKRPVYTIDLLGEPGMSVQTKVIENQKQQAEWLNEVIEGLGLKKVHIVGVSIGGWTAMNLARYNPEHIATTSLLDPVFVFAQIYIKMILASIPASVPIVPKFIREKMLSYVSGGAEINDDEPIAKLIESGMRNYKLKTPAPDLFSKEDLKNINVPVLALMAEKSTMHNSVKAVETGKKYVKDIDIVNWKNASHAINGEFSNEVNARILDFVEKHSTDN